MQDDPNRVRYWNRVAAEKTFSHPIDAALLRELVPTSARILDLGCGYGRSLADLFELGYARLVGVDTSGRMIARGRELFPHLALSVVDTGPLPLADASFDLVLLFAVLTSIPEDAAQRALIDEARRVLAPGGLLYLSDLWLQPDERNRARYAAGGERFERYGVFETPDGGTFRHHDPDWIRELTRPFEPVAALDRTFTTMNGNPAAGFQWLGRKPGGRGVIP